MRSTYRNCLPESAGSGEDQTTQAVPRPRKSVTIGATLSMAGKLFNAAPRSSRCRFR